MKLILLRHEERYYDIGFYSNLTDNGIINSLTTLPKKLDKLKIDIIFSSPFIRTLQTIYPYSNMKNKKVNLEYGLYEYIHNPYFLLYPWYYTYNDIDDEDLKSIVNLQYNSIVNKNDFNILEDENDLSERIRKFFKYLLKYHNNKTVLLVTHKGVVNKIKDIYVKSTNMSDNFEMGQLEIYDI